MQSLKVLCADELTLSTSNSIAEEKTSPLVYLVLGIKTKTGYNSFMGFFTKLLVSLSLANCNLSDDVFQRDFCNMPSLQNINLSENPISYLPDCIKGVKRLNELRLYY